MELGIPVGGHAVAANAAAANAAACRGLRAPPPSPVSPLEEVSPEDLHSNGNSAHAEKEPSWTRGNLLKHSGFMSPISSQQSEAHWCDRCDGAEVDRRTHDRAERSRFFIYIYLFIEISLLPSDKLVQRLTQVHRTQTVQGGFIPPFSCLAVLFGGGGGEGGVGVIQQLASYRGGIKGVSEVNRRLSHLTGM